MVIINSYKENANQNHSSSYPLRWLGLKMKTIISVGKAVETMEPHNIVEDIKRSDTGQKAGILQVKWAHNTASPHPGMLNRPEKM